MQAHRKQSLFDIQWSVLLLLMLFLAGCGTTIAPQSSNSQGVGLSSDSIFTECKVNTKGTEIMGVYSVSEECLMEKANTVEQCKGYLGKQIYSYGSITRNFQQDQVDSCIEKLAIRNKDTSLCPESGSKEEECYTTLAINLKNPEICLSTTNVTNCYHKYGPGNCSSYGYGASIVACIYDRLRIKKGNIRLDDMSVCGVWEAFNSQNEKEKLCISGMGAYLQNTSICDSAGTYKVDCYMAIARNNSQFTLKDCDKLGVDYIGCYVTVAARDKNPNICSQLPKDNKDSCLSNLVIFTKDYESCAQLLGNESKRCGINFAQTTPEEKYTVQFCEDSIGGGGHPPNQCFYDVATRTLNVSICDRIIGEETAKETCKTVIQHALNNK